MKTKFTFLKLMIAVSIITVIFNSCKSANYYQLTPEDLAWIVYNDGDAPKFKKPSGGIINYSAFHKTRSYTVSGDNYYEESGISIKLASDTTDLSGLLYIVKRDAGNSVTLSWPHYYGKLDLTNTVPVVQTIGGTVYPDIYIGNSANTTGINTIKTIYYSKSIGMVQFTEIDSTTWTIVK